MQTNGLTSCALSRRCYAALQVHTLASEQMFVPLQQEDCDLITHQQHSDYHSHILAMRQLYPRKPVFNIEFLYEAGEYGGCASRYPPVAP